MTGYDERLQTAINSAVASRLHKYIDHPEMRKLFVNDVLNDAQVMEIFNSHMKNMYGWKVNTKQLSELVSQVMEQKSILLPHR